MVQMIRQGLVAVVRPWLLADAIDRNGYVTEYGNGHHSSG